MLTWALALIFQKNDVYSGLGDDSSITLDGQGAHEQSEVRKARHEAKKLEASEDVNEGSNAEGGTPGGDTADPNPTVHVSAEVADQPLGTTEERYYSNIDPNKVHMDACFFRLRSWVLGQPDE